MNVAAKPKLLTKIVRAVVKSIDEDDATVQAVLSTEAADREGDIIRVDGWDLSEFSSYAPMLSSHDYHSLRALIGEWRNVTKGENGGVRALVGTARYLVGLGNEEADWGFQLAREGLAAYSVGFLVDWERAVPIEGTETASNQPNYTFNGQRLIEASHVTIPANPEALQVMSLMPLHPVMQGIVTERLNAGRPPNPGPQPTSAEALRAQVLTDLERLHPQVFEPTTPVDDDLEAMRREIATLRGDVNRHNREAQQSALMRKEIKRAIQEVLG